MIENLLKYQEIDGKIRQIEKELNDSENKKRGRHLSSYLRDAENSVKKMESRSKEINIMLNALLQSFQEKVKLVDEYEKNVETSLDLGEINYLRKKADDLTRALQGVESEVSALLREIAEISAQYDDFRNRYPAAKKQYEECRAAYEKETRERRPEAQKLMGELKTLENGIDKPVLERYKTIKGQGIFPPLVKLIENRCGGCQMEIPSGILSGIEEKGYIRCDNCHRIVYKK